MDWITFERSLKNLIRVAAKYEMAGRIAKTELRSLSGLSSLLTRYYSERDTVFPSRRRGRPNKTKVDIEDTYPRAQLFHVVLFTEDIKSKRQPASSVLLRVTNSARAILAGEIPEVAFGLSAWRKGSRGLKKLTKIRRGVLLDEIEVAVAVIHETEQNILKGYRQPRELAYEDVALRLDMSSSRVKHLTTLATRNSCGKNKREKEEHLKRLCFFSL